MCRTNKLALLPPEDHGSLELLVWPPAFGPGFGWTCCDGGGVGGGKVVVVVLVVVLAVCQGVVNAFHSARVSRETLVAS